MTVDWTSMFAPSLGLAEIVLRGTLIYLVLFVVLRFMARRQAGHFGPADMLVIVLIADAAQNALGKDYQSVTEGVLLVLTIVGWDYALDWAAWRYPSIRNIIKAPPLILVENGRLIEPNLRSEMLTGDELLSQLRQHGVDDLDDVRLASLEGDGRLSVLRKRGREAA